MTTAKRRRIYLMRHGNVTYFDDAGKPYLPEAVPLNEQGRAQAEAAITEIVEGVAHHQGERLGRRGLPEDGLDQARRLQVPRRPATLARVGAAL